MGEEIKFSPDFGDNKIKDTEVEKEELEIIPTLKEINSVFEQLTRGEKYETISQKEDEKGICSWEIVVQRNDGGTIEYSYFRKMRNKDQSVSMVIERTLFDETGVPECGEIAAKYKDGEWVELDSDIPGIFEEKTEFLRVSMENNDEAEKPQEDCIQIFTEAEESLKAFKDKHDLESLQSIKCLDRKTALNDPKRIVAVNDLKHIFNLIRSLEKEVNITKEKLDELKLKYEKLSQAVGIIAGREGVLDHTRKAFKET